MYKVNSRGKRRGNQIWTIKRHKKKETRHRPKTTKQKTKKMSDTDPMKNPSVNPGAREG